MNEYREQFKSPSDIEQFLTTAVPKVDPIFSAKLEEMLVERLRARHRTGWYSFPRWALAGVGLLALLVAGFLFTPYGKAVASSLSELFQRAELDRRSVIYPAVSSTMDNPFTQDISEMEAQAGFDILAPQELPSEVYFLGGWYDAEREIAWQKYSTFLLAQQKQEAFATDETMPPLVGPDTHVDTLPIGSVMGKYYLGAWVGYITSSSDNTGKQVVADLTWDDSLPMETLMWQQQDSVFVLIVPGKDSPLSGQQAMVAMAESLVSEFGINIPTPQTIGQVQTGQLRYFNRATIDEITYTFEAFDPAEAPEHISLDGTSNLDQAAGRHVPLPGYLPQGFVLEQVIQFPESDEILLVFMQDGNRDHVFQLKFKPVGGESTNFIEGQPDSIGASAVVLDVALENGQHAELVTGEWSWKIQSDDPYAIPQNGDTINAYWDTEIPNYHMRWEQDGWIIMLDHTGSEMWHLSQEELKDTAGNMR